MSIKYKQYLEALKASVRSGKHSARDVAQILNDEAMLSCVKAHNPELLDSSSSMQHYRTNTKLYKTFFRNIARKLNELVIQYENHEPPAFLKDVVTGERHFGRATYYWLDDQARNDALGLGAVSDARVEARVFAFRFINDYLRKFFPPSLIEELKRDIDESDFGADKFLGLDKKLKFWPGFIAKGNYISEMNQQSRFVFEALMNSTVFSASYQSLHGKFIPEQITLSPQRIEYINQGVKLLAYVHERKVYRHFQIDRLENIALKPGAQFHKLNWDRYETYYEFEFRAADWVVDYLQRIGFGEKTKVQSSGGGTSKLTGKMLLPRHFTHDGPDVFYGVNFLSSFGDALQVIKPTEIRQEFLRRTQAMLSLYENDTIEQSIPILVKSAHHQTSNEDMLDIFRKRYDDL